MQKKSIQEKIKENIFCSREYKKILTLYSFELEMETKKKNKTNRN